MQKQKIVVGITGASGALYAKVLLHTLEAHQHLIERCDIIMSEPAKEVWQYELKQEVTISSFFKVYDNSDFFAPSASGSSQYDTMIICPCTMGTLGRIAHGLSNDLMTRAADVMLKERKKLVLVTREMPLNLIHIENMKTVTLAGGIICPASPSFYFKEENISEIISSVINKVLNLAGIQSHSKKWGDI